MAESPVCESHIPKGSDYPLSVHCRAQERFSAIPRESLSAKGGPTGCGCAMLNLASTLYRTYSRSAKKKSPVEISLILG